MKAKEVRYLANIVHTLRCGEDGRHMLAAFSQKFIQSDKDGKYRSSLYEIPGINECSSPLHLMALLARMWRCSSTMSWPLFVLSGVVIFMVSAVAIFAVSALFLKTFINTDMTVTEAGDACASFAGICAGIMMLWYFFSLYLHDRQILKIVGSYGTMLDDFYESLVVADVRASWVVSAGWIFSQGQIGEVQKRAHTYLESWALWVLYNEFLNSHSAETGVARFMFNRHYFALERIGLVHGGFDPFYDKARVRFKSECEPDYEIERSMFAVKKSPDKPYIRVLPERV